MQYVTKIEKKEGNKKMKLLVQAVSKFGFKANDIWMNADKKALPDLSPIRQGDELEAEVNQKWVKSFTIVSRGNAVPNGQSQSTSAPKGSTYVEPVKNNTQEGMIRGNALNAAFGPAFTYYLTQADVAEAFQKALDVVEKVIDYATNGRKDEVPF
jgi:hypothetical protein